MRITLEMQQRAIRWRNHWSGICYSIFISQLNDRRAAAARSKMRGRMATHPRDPNMNWKTEIEPHDEQVPFQPSLPCLFSFVKEVCGLTDYIGRVGDWYTTMHFKFFQ